VLGNSRELRRLRAVKINIGCGGAVMEGWTNLDICPAPGAFYSDARNGLPFGDGAALHIHCEHFLEHLEYEAAERFLGECHRVLSAGGTLRVIVPDAEKYLTAYCRNDEEFFGGLRHLGNARVPLVTRIEIVNQMFRMGDAHRFAWDFETLELVTKRIGFSKALRSSLGDISSDLNIDGTDSWRPVESLYVNIHK